MGEPVAGSVVTADTSGARRPGSGGVQALERALGVLDVVAGEGRAMTLTELAAASGLAPATLHRLARTLVSAGYLRQEPSRRYALGPRLFLLAESASGLLDRLAAPHLAALAAEIGETANLAMLDRDRVAYVAQAPGRHAMRMFTEVGRRVHVHCTAVGKAMLAAMPEEQARALLHRTGQPRQTPHSITDPGDLLLALEQVRRQGYATDEGEQEVGVRCVAVAVPGTSLPLAMSVSGPAPRMGDELVATAVPLLRAAARELGAALS